MAIASFFPLIPAGFTFTRYMCVTSVVSRYAAKDQRTHKLLKRQSKAAAQADFIMTDVEAGNETTLKTPRTLEQLYVKHEPGEWGQDHELGFEPSVAEDFDMMDWANNFARITKNIGAEPKDRDA